MKPEARIALYNYLALDQPALTWIMRPPRRRLLNAQWRFLSHGDIREHLGARGSTVRPAAQEGPHQSIDARAAAATPEMQQGSALRGGCRLVARKKAACRSYAGANGFGDYGSVCSIVPQALDDRYGGSPVVMGSVA
jgi:hypothetical protein